MNEATRNTLSAINRRFYEREAEDFSATRDHAWPGWHRVIEALQRVGRLERNEEAGAGPSILDAGCGNGRFAAFLVEHWSGPLRYVGVDASAPLLERARARLGEHAALRFERGDVITGEGLPSEPFDGVVLFGVLHHVPGFDARCALVTSLLARLAPGGLLAATVWRFGADPRIRNRTVPFSTCGEPIDEAQLEPGDHLLRWGADGGPVRYCHFTDDEEVDRLLERAKSGPAGCRVAARFRADGKTRESNQYLLLQRDDG